MTKSTQMLLLESLNWKGGDFIPGYGYYYGLINSKLIFFISAARPYVNRSEVPYIDIDSPFKKKEFILDGIKYRLPTLDELNGILEYYEESQIFYRMALPLMFLVSDCPGYYFNRLTKSLEKQDSRIFHYRVEVLLINSIELTPTK